MSSVMEVIRKTGLFLFGVVLIVWGYKANAATNNEGAISARGGILPILKNLEENLKQQQEARQAENSEKKEETVKTNKSTIYALNDEAHPLWKVTVRNPDDESLLFGL
jgi:hypothetical protein